MPSSSQVKVKDRLSGFVLSWVELNWVELRWVKLSSVHSEKMSELFFLTSFKTYRTSKSNHLSFDHTNKNPIFFCKFLSLLKLHRNGSAFKICVWISVFRRKKRFKNPILGCWDICKINSLPFFLKHFSSTKLI